MPNGCYGAIFSELLLRFSKRLNQSEAIEFQSNTESNCSLVVLFGPKNPDAFMVVSTKYPQCKTGMASIESDFLVLKTRYEEYSMNEMKLIQQPLQIIDRPQSRGRYFDVGIGAVFLSGADTGGAYCSVDLCLAPGIGVPRHTWREDDSCYVPSGERQSAARNGHLQIKE